MSMEKSTIVNCPDCGTQFKTTIWRSLNSNINPVEKDLLLSGKLFDLTCPKCQAVFSVVYPILYHDMTNGVMILLAVEDLDKDGFGALKRMENDFPELYSMAQELQYRIVKNKNDLVEKARIFCCGLDDRVIEIQKQFYLAGLYENNPELNITKMYFEDGSPYKFVLFSDDKYVGKVDVNIEQYKMITDSDEGRKLNYIEKSKNCYFIDDVWASAFFTEPSALENGKSNVIKLLSKITEQKGGGKKMKIVDTIISSAENMQSALDISAALPNAKSCVMLNLFRELRRLFENDSRAVKEYYEEAALEYYHSRKKVYPSLYIEIERFPHNISATLGIEVEDQLYFWLAFTNESDEIVEKDWVKTKYHKVYESFTHSVVNQFGELVDEPSLIYWDYLSDENGIEYDFKKFSPSCVSLASNYKEQAQVIFDKLFKYVNVISQNNEPSDNEPRKR